MKKIIFITSCLAMVHTVYTGNGQSRTLSFEQKMVNSIKAKDFDFAIRMLTEEEDLSFKGDWRDEDGMTLLHSVIAAGDIRVLTLLLSKLKDGYNLKLPIKSYLEKDAFMCSATMSHNEAILGVYWSPNGTHFVIRGIKMAALWDGKGSLIKQLEHKDKLRSIKWSPNSLSLLTDSWDNRVRLWDIFGQLRHIFEHSDRISGFVWSLDGKFIRGSTALEIGGTWTSEGIPLSNSGEHILWDWQKKLTNEDSPIELAYNDMSDYLLDYFGEGQTLSYSPNGIYLLMLSVSGSVTGLRFLSNELRTFLFLHRLVPEEHKLTYIGYDDLLARRREIFVQQGPYCDAWEIEAADKARSEIREIDFYIKRYEQNFNVRVAILARKIMRFITFEEEDLLEGISWKKIAEWSHDGKRVIMGKNADCVMLCEMKGTSIEWAVTCVLNGTDIKVLKLLLNECDNIGELCSNTILLDLCCAASAVRNFQPEKYRIICGVIAMLSVKPGAPL